MRKELKPNEITAIVDTREQNPVDLSPLGWQRQKLDTGDYSVKGLQHIVSIEVKTHSDLLRCVGVERERFDRQVQRMLAYQVRAIVVCATWSDLERPPTAGRKITSSQAIGSLLGWIALGLPVVMAGNKARAGRYVSRLLFIAARRRWRESRGLVEHISGQMVATRTSEQ